jgi:hypothetical protein
MPDTKHNPSTGENWEPVQGWPLWSRRLIPDGSGWIWSLTLQQGGPHFPAIVFVPNVMSDSNNPDMGQVMAALTRIEQGITTMSGSVQTLQSELDATKASVDAMKAAVDGFIAGLPAMIQAAVDAAGLTPDQAAQFTALQDEIKAEADAITAAGNPQPAPTPTP